MKRVRNVQEWIESSVVEVWIIETDDVLISGYSSLIASFVSYFLLLFYLISGD